jgi:adenine-specific DNA-methyltransferase
MKLAMGAACWSAVRHSGWDANRYANLTVKKIPKMVLSRCEWGHDDYSLNVENLPMQEKAAPKQAVTPQQAGLFEEQRGKDSAEGAA